MREIVHIQAGQCGNQIGAKVNTFISRLSFYFANFLCATGVSPRQQLAPSAIFTPLCVALEISNG